MVGREQVGGGRHQVGLRDTGGSLGAALRLWIDGLAGSNLDAVVAAGGHELGVADRDAGHPGRW